METLNNERIAQERRQSTPEKSVLWNKLSITQKFSATNLTQFGYDLTYVRSSDSGNLAIMLCGNNTATVDNDGDINTSPNIIIR